MAFFAVIYRKSDVAKTEKWKRGIIGGKVQLAFDRITSLTLLYYPAFKTVSSLAHSFVHSNRLLLASEPVIRLATLDLNPISYYFISYQFVSLHSLNMPR